MADTATATATDVRVVAAAEPGSLAAEANAAVRSVSMPVVDRVPSGVGTAVTPIVLIIGKYFGWTSHLLVCQDLLSRAIPTWGEAWHNTYHAFPTSSRHEADGHQIDLSAQFIELMEKLGSVYDVVRVGPARCAQKALKAVS
jgi:hypothetical protein